MKGLNEENEKLAGIIQSLQNRLNDLINRIKKSQNKLKEI